MLYALGIIVALFVTVYLLARYKPQTTERWWTRIDTSRKALTGLVWASIGFVLLMSGVGTLMLLGIVIWAFIAFSIVFNTNPREVISEWT